MRYIRSLGLIVVLLAALAYHLWFGEGLFKAPESASPVANAPSNPNPAGNFIVEPAKISTDDGANISAAITGAVTGIGSRATTPAAQEPPTELRSSAKAYVETLTRTADTTLPASNAAHFVTAQQQIALQPARNVEALSLRQLKLDPALFPTTPITVVRQVPQVELASAHKLIADAGGDLKQRIQVLVNDKLETLSLREVLSQQVGKPNAPISVIRMSEYLEATTVAQLFATAPTQEPDGSWDTMIRVIKGHYKPGTTTVADLLAGIEGVEKDSVFYVHSVRDSDTQGVWGIIHDGLMRNFARGMAVRRGDDVDRYQVTIPRDADERRSDNSSSFLGKLIDDKSRTSAVYNFTAGRMSRNPNLVIPGSEIVIINFSPADLVQIYQHFLAEPQHDG